MKKKIPLKYVKKPMKELCKSPSSPFPISQLDQAKESGGTARSIPAADLKEQNNGLDSVLAQLDKNPTQDESASGTDGVPQGTGMSSTQGPGPSDIDPEVTRIFGVVAADLSVGGMAFVNTRFLKKGLKPLDSKQSEMLESAFGKVIGKWLPQIMKDNPDESGILAILAWVWMKNTCPLPEKPAATKPVDQQKETVPA